LNSERPAEFVVVAVCSIAVGEILGFLQSVSIWRFFVEAGPEWSKQSWLFHAAWGLLGVPVGLAVGLFVYYVVARRQLDRRAAATIVIGSVSFCIVAGFTASWISVFLTPAGPISIALWAVKRPGGLGDARARVAGLVGILALGLAVFSGLCIDTTPAVIQKTYRDSDDILYKTHELAGLLSRLHSPRAILVPWAFAALAVGLFLRWTWAMLVFCVFLAVWGAWAMVGPFLVPGGSFAMWPWPFHIIIGCILLWFSSTVHRYWDKQTA
jgi:hypothetical protein